MIILKPLGETKKPSIWETITSAAERAGEKYLDFLKWKAEFEASKPFPNYYPSSITISYPVLYQPPSSTVPKELWYLLGAGVILLILTMILKD